MIDKQFWIFIIPFGKENAISQKDLAAKRGITPAKLKAEIRKARLNGIEICSGQTGYYFPKDDEERRAFYNMQRKQALSRFMTSKTVKHSLENVDGQLSMDDTGEECQEREETTNE